MCPGYGVLPTPERKWFAPLGRGWSSTAPWPFGELLRIGHSSVCGGTGLSAPGDLRGGSVGSLLKK